MKPIKSGYSFCSICSDASCTLNKAMCIIVATTAELIEKTSKMGENKNVKLSMLDFFTKDEIEHFLQNFTTQGYPVSYGAKSPDWVKANVNWPRKMTGQINLKKASIRYDVKGKDIYREDVWDGFYTEKMFEVIPDDEQRFPDNFDELLDSAFGAVDESIISIDLNETILPTFSHEQNASNASTTSADSDESNTITHKWDRWSEKNLRDATWRREAKDFYTRLIQTTKKINKRNKGNLREI